MIWRTFLQYTFLITVALLGISCTVATPPSQPKLLRDLLGQESRIINGTTALLNGTKHQASLRDRTTELFRFGLGHLCGASLVSDNVVLCAAHCFQDTNAEDDIFLSKTEFLVVMGNLNRTEKNNNTLIFDIKEIIKYNDIFNSETYDDDIVILILNDTVPADHPTVQPIQLNAGPLKEGTKCQVTGWGNTEEGILPEELRITDVPIISMANCHNHTVYGDSIHEGMLCAGHMKGEHDACQGDSGGPFVCGGLQAGIVSWGLDCGKPNQPGIYTNVAFYRHWILSKVAEYNASMPKFVDKSVAEKPDGAMSSFNGSVVLISLMTAFVAIVSQF